MINVVVKENEHKEMLITNNVSINFLIEKNGSLFLKYGLLKDFSNIEIIGKLNAFSSFTCAFADFSRGKGTVKANIHLDEEGAIAKWELASLATNDDKKEFDISFVHHSEKTIANMNNYGVSLNTSSLIFSGVNHIKKNAKKSKTNQNAKIIVFDKNAKGIARPVLKIDENDVLASHSASVGEPNKEHLFYLESRGLSLEQAKALIVLGYLNPIASFFSEEEKKEINNLIIRKCHV